MTDTSIAYAAIDAIAIVVVIYVIWSSHRIRTRSKQTADRDDLITRISRELDSHHAVILSRFTELQRKLDDQRRILKYLARRLS